MDYGKALRTLRGIRDMSQKELAKKAKLDASFVSLIEANKREPSDAKLLAIARALRVPIYLISLLASEEEDLVGADVKNSHALAQQLVALLVSSEKST